MVRYKCHVEGVLFEDMLMSHKRRKPPLKAKEMFNRVMVVAELLSKSEGHQPRNEAGQKTQKYKPVV